jgi:hypothetical protein
MWFRAATVVLGAVSFIPAVACSASEPTPFAEFVLLNYSWDAAHQHDQYVEAGLFVPENCLLAGIKLGPDNEMFVTVPRWKSGVPGTLNKVVPGPGPGPGGGQEYSLQPYPSWDMQREGVEGDLQNCQSMFIERSRPRMW